MMRQRVERRIGRGQYFKSKAFEKGPRAKFRLFQFFRYRVVVLIGIFRRKTRIQFKEFMKCKIQP